jgi:ATP-binding cassette subfamily B protein
MASKNLILLRRTLVQARPYWFHTSVLFFLSLLAIPIALLKPFALKLLIDSGFGTEPLPAFIRALFSHGYIFTFTTVVVISVSLFVLVALIDNIIIFISWVLTTYTGEKLVLGLRAVLFNHVQRLSLAYHDARGSSDSLYRIQWDTMSIRNVLLTQLSGLVSSALTLLAMMIVMFFINWKFAAITFCLIPPLIILTKLSTKRLLKDWYKVKDSESGAMSVIHEVLNSLRVVKAFGQEKTENNRFNEVSDAAVRGNIHLARGAAMYSFIVGMLLALGTAGFIYAGALFVKEGSMTIGDLTLVIAYITQIFTPLQSIIKNINDIQASIASMDRVFTVLDNEKEVVESPNAIHLRRSSGEFQFQNVGFAYANGKRILNELSFKVEPGDRVGVMGSTGAGKSTLINLLNRFYDPAYGMITIDGTDIKNYKLEDYRNQFSIVLQEPVLFSTSIRENIAYGRPGATEVEIIEAAKAANAHEFILHSKEGYDTLVGERGMQLSGGERQRISIARAFIRNAPVLILDEPTSSLDIGTEAQIMEAIEKLMEGRTTFMITHRLDTLNSCNLLLHLENGKLIDVVRDHDKNYIAQKKSALLNSA